MFIEILYETIEYMRPSKTGKLHTYTRTRAVIKLRCDNCSEIFIRPRSRMQSKRMNNNYFHVCEQCDAKKFAQKKRMQRTKILDMNASSLEDISKL